MSNLLRAHIPSSRVLVELLTWRGGAEKHDKLPKIGSRAFNLFQTEIGGDELTATGDGDKMLARWKQTCDFQRYL